LLKNNSEADATQRSFDELVAFVGELQACLASDSADVTLPNVRSSSLKLAAAIAACCQFFEPLSF